MTTPLTPGPITLRVRYSEGEREVIPMRFCRHCKVSVYFTGILYRSKRTNSSGCRLSPTGLHQV